jgi:hypothetical protein
VFRESLNLENGKIGKIGKISSSSIGGRKWHP